MRDWSQPKEFEEDSFKTYPVFSRKNLEVIKDDFNNLTIDTYKYRISLCHEDIAFVNYVYNPKSKTQAYRKSKIIIYNQLALNNKIMIFRDEEIPDFIRPLWNIYDFKRGQDVEFLVDRLLKLKAFL